MIWRTRESAQAGLLSPRELIPPGYPAGLGPEKALRRAPPEAARLFVARPQRGARMGHDRHLQPVALRRRARGEGPRPGTEIHLVEALPADQRFRRMLSESGVRIIKFLLYISKEEQSRRFRAPERQIEELEVLARRYQGARVLGPVHRGFYFRGSKRTSTSVLTLTGWRPWTGG